MIRTNLRICFISTSAISLMETSVARIRKIKANNPLRNMLEYVLPEGNAIAGAVTLSVLPALGKGLPSCKCRFDRLEDNNMIESKVIERKSRTIRFVPSVIVYSLKGFAVSMTSIIFPGNYIDRSTSIPAVTNWNVFISASFQNSNPTRSIWEHRNKNVTSGVKFDACRLSSSCPMSFVSLE